MSTTEVRSIKVPVREHDDTSAYIAPSSMVWAAAKPDDAGNKLLLMFKTQNGAILLTSHDPEHLLANGRKLFPELDLDIMQAPLGDIAHIVDSNRGMVLWVDGDRDVWLPPELTYLMKNAGLLADSLGNTALYVGAALPLINESHPLPAGILQRWDCPHGGISTEKSPAPSTPPTMWVYDDRLDWSQAAFPPLPSDAVARSALCSNGQALFQRVQDNASPGPETVSAASIISNSLLPPAALDYFNRLYRQVEEKLVPALDQIQLELTDPVPEEGVNHIADTLQLDIRFPAAYGNLSGFGRSWHLPAELQRDPELPAAKGVHPMPTAMRQRLVRYLSWQLLHYSRQLDVSRSPLTYRLCSFIPAPLSNSAEIFRWDSQDERFPCLARARIANTELAVLLLGQIRSSFVCQPLDQLEIPAAEIPRQIPRWQDLVCPEDQAAFLNEFTTILLPTSMVDFPQDWYQGIHLQEEYMVDLLRQEMLLAQELEESIKANREETSLTPVAKHALWVGLIGVLFVGLVMLLDH